MSDQRVKELIAETFGATVEAVKDDAALKNMSADSIEHIELCMAIEDDFGIEIPDEDFERLLTVQQVMDYVRARTVGQVARQAA